VKLEPITVSRRQVLRGAGGFTLGLPFLASLATPRGSLAAVGTPMRKRFVAAFTGHGGLRPATIYWDQATPRKEMLFPGHTISAGDLAPRVEAGKVVFSSAIQIPQDILSDRLLRKMNVYRALDVPFFTDHTTGTWLGNFARTGDPSEFRGEDPRQTIDNVLGWSNSFYGSLDGIRERVLQMGTMNWENEYSWRYSNPSAKSGSLVAVRAQQDPGRVWDSVFRGFTPPTPGMAAPATPAPKPVVDLVIEDYRRLRQSNTRLSAEDKQRLDDHLDRLADLERKVADLRQSPPSAVSCNNLPARPAFGCGSGPACPGDPRRYVDVYTDIVAAAFMCGLSRIAVLNQKEKFVSNFNGDWHQGVAHTHNQTLLAENFRNTLSYLAASLAKKLDVEEANGRTFLDNSLIMFTNENGYDTHSGQGLPVITFGSAGGYFKTGQLVDFRRNQADARGHGITYNQWLAIVLQSMGLPRSEFEVGGQQGYGRMRVGKNSVGKYVPEAISQASRVPELIKA
jgi:hypothetical protein